MMDPVLIGKTIKKYRKMKGLSQRNLGALSGVGRNHICAIEVGKGRPNLDTLFKLCQALGIRMSKLFRDMEKEMYQ